jgi:hypothetical protein
MYATASRWQMPRQQTLGDTKMFESLNQTAFEATARNVVPFPAKDADSATGNDGQMKLYTADELKAVFAPDAQTTRTVRDLVAKVREAYHWLDEFEFKRGDKLTQFTFDQIKAMKESGLTQKQWIAEIQKLEPKPTPVTTSDSQEQPIEGELLDELGLDRGILARYEKKPQQQQQSQQITPYFQSTDYQSRYTSAEQRLQNQKQKEVNFANDLLVKFADFVEDDTAWKQSEAQNSEARQREMAMAGMREALGDFLQKNTAYRSMMEKLESGEISPEQVAEFLRRMQNQSPNAQGQA